MRLGHPLGMVALLVLFAGCDRVGRGAPLEGWQEAGPAVLTPQARPEAGAGAVPVPQGARTAAAFDRTTPAERAAAVAAPATGAALGQVVVSLGNPAEPGFWLRSSLVSAPRPGTVRLASGGSVQVDLLPPSGGAAQLSLAAYRALGLGLTDLPQVTVLGR